MLLSQIHHPKETSLYLPIMVPIGRILYSVFQTDGSP